MNQEPEFTMSMYGTREDLEEAKAKWALEQHSVDAARAKFKEFWFDAKQISDFENKSWFEICLSCYKAGLAAREELK